jgi:hypothetical protein
VEGSDGGADAYPDQSMVRLRPSAPSSSRASRKYRKDQKNARAARLAAQLVSETKISENAQVPEVKTESRGRLATKRILVWALFGAFFGLMPLFARMLQEIFSPVGFSIDELLMNGELFIVSAVLSAGALGELLAAASKGMGYFVAVLTGFFCLATFAANTIAFVVATSASPGQVTVGSLYLFPFSLLSSGVCVWTAAYG